jgi:hypothetical protein
LVDVVSARLVTPQHQCFLEVIKQLYVVPCERLKRHYPHP